jgi:hypothetical protein
MKYPKESQKLTLNQFTREHSIHINNILHILDTTIKNENYKVLNKEKLFKTLVRYIYLNSHHYT